LSGATVEHNPRMSLERNFPAVKWVLHLGP
jgi:hypothetical protein